MFYLIHFTDAVNIFAYLADDDEVWEIHLKSTTLLTGDSIILE